MDYKIELLLIAAVINIACLIGAAYGKTALKPLVILSGVAVVWLGFLWQSFLGAVGSYIGILLIVGILRSTVLKRSLDKRHRTL